MIDYELGEILEIYFLELSKFSEIVKGNIGSLGELDKWLLFLLSQDGEYYRNVFEEALGMDGMDKHPVVKANEELLKLSSDSRVREMAESREKYIRDEENRMAHAEEKGIKLGKIEEKIKNAIVWVNTFNASDELIVNNTDMGLEQVQTIRKIMIHKASMEEVARVFDIEVEDVPKIHDSFKNE
ncbi:hypothetical protein bcgnr5390_12160 [Bacillus luti]|nr:hypothetical protein BC2903_50840 [Bacillus cereus]